MSDENNQWKLLSDDSVPPINKLVILKDSKGSVSLTKLKYIWEHQSYPICVGDPTNKSYWMLLPDIKDEYPSEEMNKKLPDLVEELDLSHRILNCLHNEEIFCIKDLCNKNEYDLLKIPNLGMKSMKKIKNVLEKNGLSLNHG